ncbi:hypothetical protein ACWGKQ_29725 [Streptomyces sp. NPDC054770]
MSSLRDLPEEELLGDWSGRIPDLREAAVRAVLAEAVVVPPLDPVTVRRSSRARWSWAVAAGAAGVVLGFGVSLLAAPDRPPGSAPARPAGLSVLRATGADGIAASIEPQRTGWGTRVLLELSGVSGPQSCSLVAVSHDGKEETAFTWQVPEGGYGLPGSAKERLLGTGGVGIPPGEVTSYVIRTAQGKQLLSIASSAATA